MELFLLTLIYKIMKLKIMSFVVVFVFVMSMFPMNVFANDISRHGTSHSSCRYGTVNGYTGYHTETYTRYRRCTPDSSGSGSGIWLGILLVGLIVWAVWPKDIGYANTNFEEVEDNLSATESTNNWGWTASYDYEEDSYSLGASYGF